MFVPQQCIVNTAAAYRGQPESVRIAQAVAEA
jgi:hypothetical protein